MRKTISGIRSALAVQGIETGTGSEQFRIRSVAEEEEEGSHGRVHDGASGLWATET